MILIVTCLTVFRDVAEIVSIRIFSSFFSSSFFFFFFFFFSSSSVFSFSFFFNSFHAVEKKRKKYCRFYFLPRVVPKRVSGSKNITFQTFVVKWMHLQQKTWMHIKKH